MPSGIYKRSKELIEKISKNLDGQRQNSKWLIKNKKYANTHKDIMKKKGKLGATVRWNGHINKNPPYIKKGLYTITHDKSIQLQKKRFRNQRYKIRKRNATGKHSFGEWLLLKNRCQNMCLCCKKTEPEVKLTEDHIMPISKGGTDYIENIQPLCVSCNTKKYTKYFNYLNLKGA